MILFCSSREFSGPVLGLAWIANIVQWGHTSWGRLKELFAAPVEIQDDEFTDRSLSDIRGDIVFDRVSLKFNDFVALDEVSFRLPAGAKLGITGRTGSGKTMIAYLLARVLEPTSGIITVGGINLKHYPIEVLRRNIGMVPQEPFLFSDSIAENIAYGIPQGDNPEALRQKVKEVAGIVQVAHDVEDFPKGYDTMLGERGVTLSGGQRQRVAMARAIIRDPSLLILDDALSAVDTQTESNILRALKEVMVDRSTIIIGHRVSAFKACDHILVLDEGRITEEGSHDHLVQQDGWYAEIDRKQQLEAELEVA
ncbi:MAG: ABC transporter ATP-binding protein [Deinococcales bacterium]